MKNKLIAVALLGITLGTCQAATPDYVVTTGRVAKLRSVAVNGYAPVATSLEAFNELSAAKVANDREGIVEMVRTGRVLPTKAGDSVRILDHSWFGGWSKVRLLSGTYAGRAVWVYQEWVIAP